MGTSTGYKMPTGGEWTPLKGEATRFAKDGPEASNVTPEKLLLDYLKALGGPSGIGGQSQQGDYGGGGQSSAGGKGGSSAGGGSRAAVRVGRNLVGFLSQVGSAGLTQALINFGLSHLIGCTASELSSGLLDALAGPGSTVDKSAARAALSTLNEEILHEVNSAEEVEKALMEELDASGLAGILMRFFALYIFARFCRDFYERWVKVAGSEATEVSIKSIRGYIDARLRSRIGRRDVTDVDWQGNEGKDMVAQVLADTCAVFGVPS